MAASGRASRSSATIPSSLLAPSLLQISGTGNFSFVDQNKTDVQPVELIDISVGEGTARAYGAVASACMTNATGGDLRFTYTTLAYDRDGADGTFLVSLARNILVGVGMDVSTTVSKFHTTPTEAQGVNYPVNCQSILAGNPKIASNGSCSGRGCCQASLLTEAFPLNGYSVVFNNLMSVMNNPLWVTNPCSLAMVVEKSWYNFSTADLYGDTSNKFPRGVPYVFDFAIRNVSCPADGLEPPDDYACVSGNSTCVDVANGYVCKCLEHYEGNPYIRNGCYDIDEQAP
nr:unnamed protein product [Digitaria exilis]